MPFCTAAHRHGKHAVTYVQEGHCGCSPASVLLRVPSRTRSPAPQGLAEHGMQSTAAAGQAEGRLSPPLRAVLGVIVPGQNLKHALEAGTVDRAAPEPAADELKVRWQTRWPSGCGDREGLAALHNTGCCMCRAPGHGTRIYMDWAGPSTAWCASDGAFLPLCQDSGVHLSVYI